MEILSLRMAEMPMVSHFNQGGLKMKKLFLAIATVAMLFATSCNKENKNPAVNPEDIPEGSFLCTIDNSAMPQNAPRISDGMTTMTAINNDGIYWRSDDQILINGITYDYAKEEGTGVYFTTTSTEATAPYYAFYPTWINGQNSNHATLLSEIDAYSDKDVYNLPMYAYSASSKLLTFHNICAVLEIKMPDFGTQTCNKIIVRADQDLCGAFNVNSNFVAVLDNQTGTNNTITVTPEGSYTIQKNHLVYVPIPAGSYTNFKFEFFQGSTSLHETPTQSISVVANKIYPVTINYTPPTPPTSAPITNPFCFEPVSGTATIRLSGNGTAPSLEYRLNNGTDAWQTFNVNQDYQVTNPNTLCIRATSTATNNCFASTTDGTSNYHFTCTGTNVKVKGNICYLLKNEIYTTATKFTNPSINAYAFACLFKNMGSLTDASGLILVNSWNNPPKGIYQGLFEGCSALTLVPSLNLEYIPENGYKEIFKGCTALTSVEITNLSNAEYTQQGCTNIGTNGLLDWLSGAGGSSGNIVTVPDGFIKGTTRETQYCAYNIIIEQTPTNWTISSDTQSCPGTKQP